MSEGGEVGIIGKVKTLKELPKKTAIALAKKYPRQVYMVQKTLQENPRAPVLLSSISLVWSGANLINHFTPEGLAFFLASSYGLKEGVKLTKQLLQRNKTNAEVLAQLNNPESELGKRIRKAMQESQIKEDNK